MSSVGIPSPHATNVTTPTRAANSNSKNEIKVSAEGIAKLTFNFLDELQGDSSLEPGEVKTPPHNTQSSPITMREMSPFPKADVQPPPPPQEPSKETALLTKQFKSVSQLEAEMCEEKVRAILELDAIKRRQDAEKRKQQMENRRRSGELDEDEEVKKKAKEERRRLKKLKKEQEAARLALQSDDDSDNEKGIIKPKKKNKNSKEHESYSSDQQHSSPERSDELRSVVNSVSVSSSTRYPPLGLSGPPHLPPFPDSFMSFRPMNPFMRGGSRPDFHHGRGGFIPRGRGGGMRGGGMRFSGGYRPPFFNNGLPRHHGLIGQQQHRQHTPPPPRGHSPIQPPNSNLRWTNTKPSLSYAFNPLEDKRNKYEQKSEDSSVAIIEKSQKTRDKPRRSKSSQCKKLKKQHEREKIKKRRSSRNSSEKSSKRKIEKIRESLKKPERELTDTQIVTIGSSVVKDHKSNPVKIREEEDEVALDPEEMWDVVENIKVEKDLDNVITPIFELSKDIVKVETDSIKSNKNENASEGNTNSNEACSTIAADIANEKVFDMFADSPPRSQPTTKDIDNLLNAVRKAVEKRDVSDFETTNTYTKLEQNKCSKESSPEKHCGTPPLPPATTITTNSNKTSDKTQLQKALEIQKRIDKLLQDDDLKLETIQATKEKLFQKTKRHAKESNQTKITIKENLRSLTPELPKHKNPFKRSISRDRYFGKIDPTRRSSSRTRDRDRDNRTMHKSSVERGRSGQRFRQKSLNRSHSGDSNYKGSSSSLNRSYSKDSADRNQKGKVNTSKRRSDTHRKLSKSPYKRQRSFSNDKSKFLECNPTKSNTPPASKSHFKRVSSTNKQKAEPLKKSGVAKKKKISKPPLSFTAAEFLFPEENDDIDDINIERKGGLIDDEDTVSSSKNTKSVSPDTDDYMDNWENDDADTDLNSNAACESSTPLQLSQEDVDYKFVNRFVNPSPPMDFFAIKQNEAKTEIESNTPTNSPPPSITASAISGPIEKPRSSATNDKDNISTSERKTSENNELFGMQEIYDQFIKSVEDSGVDIKTASNTPDMTRKVETVDETLSTSSTSTSSSSSSSSSESSSSSSATSSSASSSDDSNDAHSFEKSSATAKSPKDISFGEIVTSSSCKNNNSVPAEEFIKHTSKDSTKSSTPTVEALHTVTATPPPPPSSQKLENKPLPLSSTSIPAKAQKSDVAKDFKKLKSLEANLARIQMMRANYDSADEISEELLKMEKLFLQEKNLILQKYAKSTGATTTESNTQTTEQNQTPSTGAVPPPLAGIFVQSMQHSEIPERASPPIVANKIFDSNREAIKLTISPLKLPKTPAIFEKAEDNEADTSKRSSEPEEADFTDKLVKPVKEIAIVKPFPDSRSSHQRHRRSPATSQSRASNNDRQRSPSGYRGADRSRRSTSRSRFSPSRRGRVRSLSVSPSRRVGRNISPQRRAGYSSTQTRYRTLGRRSRSRSITRQSGRRGDLSPPSHRRRRPAGSAAQQGSSGSLSSHFRKSTQLRSGSRSPRSSPPHAARHRSPRPHSPRSPSSNRRRSYSRDRYSRSPLPFKPPSPPMRRSLSPIATRRPSSLSPQRSSSRRSRSRSHSRSPRMPRSPRSPPPSRGYDDHRRRRDDSYDRRSLSPQHQYYSQDAHSTPGMPASSSYYYNLSPNRISLDARINIVLNGPSAANQEDVSGNILSYESYSNYSQYGGAAYMPVPPNGGNYYANQYVPMSSSGPAATGHAHPHQQIYSNIPTISGAGGGPHPSIAPPHHAHALASNYYYNEFAHPPPAVLSHHQSSSLLKELPKAAVAVQKGNVLEIVPSSEISMTSSAATSKSTEAQTKPTKPKIKSAAVAWKEEINNRHVTAAVLRLSRENDGASRSILKKSEAMEEPSNDDKPLKKKVYFEDGIFPNRESDDEDRKVIDAKIRIKLRRLRKRHGVNTTGNNLEAEKKPKDEIKIDPELEKLPPPPPPATMVPSYLEQPIYLRPPTPTPLLYFHFDSVVHSMYVSQQERAIPPRLLNPKCIPAGSNASAGVVTPHNATTQSPSHTQSPIGPSSAMPSSNLHNPKKDLNALAAHNRSSRTDRVPQRRESPALQQQQQHLQTPPMDAMQLHHLQHQHHPELTPPPTLSTTSTMAKGTFQAIATTTPPHSPQMHTGTYPSTSQRQSSPIGFAGMRINNFMRLPPSPLAAAALRNTPPSTVPVLGIRHTYNMPPPTMFPPPPLQQAAGSPHPADFSTQQYPPPPHHHHHHRPPHPNYFMQTAPPLPLTALHNIETNSAIAAAANCANTSKDCSSPQAMIAPFNVKRAFPYEATTQFHSC